MASRFNDELFKQWPENQLEPQGNPAYEGTGYPSAGYGQSRRRVVPLPAGKGVNPQLVGWENPQPIGQRIIPRGTINLANDAFTRAELSVLQGLRGASFGRLDQVSAGAPSAAVIAARIAQGRAALAEVAHLFTEFNSEANSYWFKAKEVAATAAAGLPGGDGLQVAYQGVRAFQKNYEATARRQLDTLPTAAGGADRNWQAWLDATRSMSEHMSLVLGNEKTSNLFALVRFVAAETATDIVKRTQKFGESTLKVTDWLSNPWMLAGIGLGVLAIVVYARSGGSIIQVEACIEASIEALEKVRQVAAPPPIGQTSSQTPNQTPNQRKPHMRMNEMVETGAGRSVGVGQYSSYEGMIDGLGWLGMTQDEVLMGVSGVGAVAQAVGNSTMDSIIANAREMRSKFTALQRARVAVVKADPSLAPKLAAAMQKTAAPGTNEAKGVVDTLEAASQKAAMAKQYEVEAKAALAQNDTRAAAAKSVNALTFAREAMTLANRAEKTRLTRSLDITADTLMAQASFLERQAKASSGRTGDSLKSTAQNATAANLREQARKLKAKSAVVAMQPNVPAGAPSSQRIADLANKFNVRTIQRGAFDERQAMLSVLSDFSDNPMAQVRDYEGASTYYGNDDSGRIMADIEFGNKSGAVNGLARMVHGLGYSDTVPCLADADRAVATGQALARQVYSQFVLPAAQGLSGGGLGGLGALGGAWEDWCDRQAYSADEKQRCKVASKFPFFYAFAPHTAAGQLERGLKNVGAAIVQALPVAIQTVQQTFAPKPASVPANAIPAPQIPAQSGIAVAQQTVQDAANLHRRWRRGTGCHRAARIATPPRSLMGELA